MKTAVLVLAIIGTVFSFSIGACTGAFMGGMSELSAEMGDTAGQEEMMAAGAGFLGLAILQANLGLVVGSVAFVKFNNKNVSRIAVAVLIVAALLSIHNLFQILLAGSLFSVAGLLALIGAGKKKEPVPEAQAA